jgi:hypothetical protein
MDVYWQNFSNYLSSVGVVDKHVSACELGGYRSVVVGDLKSLAM